MKINIISVLISNDVCKKKLIKTQRSSLIYQIIFSNQSDINKFLKRKTWYSYIRKNIHVLLFEKNNII